MGTSSLFQIDIGDETTTVDREWYEIHRITNTNVYVVIQRRALPEDVECACPQISGVQLSYVLRAHYSKPYGNPFYIYSSRHLLCIQTPLKDIHVHVHVLLY